MHRRITGLALALSVSTAAFVAGTPAFAAETVAVQLIGERGGKMDIKLDKSEVPAGTVTFKVANVAKETPHEMIVVKLDKAGQEFKVDPATNRVDEKQFRDLGEVEGLKAGRSGELTLDLQPGDYKLICNLKGHYAAGMVVPFTVKAG